MYNLKKRHVGGKPYTRTGDIVIAVNPFQWFLDLYTEQKRRYYSNRIVWEQSDKDPRDTMEPHVYEVSALAYKGLAFECQDQSILVSGESGAGKTETVKICMNHMASVQRGPVKTNYLLGDETTDDLDPVVQRVVESNPLLEAFGNACTRRNDNSSRFGKYLQLQFDSSQRDRAGNLATRTTSKCVLAGSKCEVYLLEKNRVCAHEEKERTFHVFYQLLAAPDSVRTRYWSKLKGTDNNSFKYVGQPPITKIEGKSDAEHFEHTISTLELIGVKGDKLKTLMQAICAVLQCGNLVFGAKGGDRDKSEIRSTKEAADLADLMGVSQDDLTVSFTERTMTTKTETYKVPLNETFAKDACDAFAKEVYGKLFLWVVKQINDATCAEDNYKGGTMDSFGLVGLLDIFGFESFVVNRFEQLCINYANEKLQQKFTEDVFRSVQAEYEAEGIELSEIMYDDNTDVLDLIESRSGLLAMLNEECVRPQGNDQAFVQKALAANKSSGCLITNSYDRMSFGIHHYAGKVMYDADGMVASNQDTLPTDLEALGNKSTNSIISDPIAKFGNDGLGDSAVPMRGGPAKRKRSNIVAPTAWSKYKSQLSHLMGALQKTNSRYIRCIKPNMKKKPELMEHIPTMEQLRCAGVVAAVTLARSAFPNRLDNNAVRYRYSSMWDRDAYPSKKTREMTPQEAAQCDCDAMMTSALKCKEVVNKDGKLIKGFVVGKTKTFFRAGCLEYLESNRMTGLDTQATTIQRIARGYVVRKQLANHFNSKKEEEQAERERREREAAERKAKHAAKIAELNAARATERKQLEDQLADLKRKIKEEEQERERKLEELRERKEQAEQDTKDLEKKTSEEAKRALKEPKKLAAVQKKKLEEQAKMIDFLKKENRKNRKAHEKIKSKFDVVKENNEKLVRASENAGDEFDLLNGKSRRVNDKNEDYMSRLELAKKGNKELKQDCMRKQEEYMTQAETRLEYQKTMARILNMIQDTSKDPGIVEDTVVIALECEAEAKSIMAELEAETE